ncbi:MAG TPA: response regulator transcription factor [Gemmatimonadales bacterium]|jgi:two-component system alkaline phosphatase synthesis response regulator PhoP|nr:response regulator transcription factor [Gemmatimonadales bacterium]
MRAIIVDDEAPARRRLRGVLQQIGAVTRIDECANGHDAVELLKRGTPDLVFLDIQMPDLDGFAVAAAASEERPPAIVFVTAYDEHAVHAFEIQAFDYLLKPFDDDRVIATVKRAGEFLEWIRGGREGTASGEAVLSGFGDVKVDFASHQVRRDGHSVDLRPKEYALLVALLKRGGRVASRLELLREVWGYAEDVMSRTVDTHIAMLRRKLEDDPATPRHIVTVRTFGYRIER